MLVVLSSQFLKWNVDLPVGKLPDRDISNYYNNFYVYFGPLSSIMLIPFVFIFGNKFPQISIGIFTLISSFVGIYYISKYFKFNKIDSLYLSTFFVFSTVLYSSSLINITAWQVEALGVSFVILSLLFYFKKKHGLLVGFFLACAVLTRITLILAISFFILEFLQKRLGLKKLIIIFIPIIISVGILGLYNQKRFHSFFETGYKYNVSKNDMPIGANLKYQEISIMHLPANLYSFFIMSPLPVKEEGKGLILKFPYLMADAWGVAIWFTSPLFLFLLTNFRKNKYTYSSLITIFLLSIPVFTWYSVGFAQFGYRYTLDFLPFLFLLLIPCLGPKLSKPAVVLIILGIVFNIVYSNSIFASYPVFFIK